MSKSPIIISSPEPLARSATPFFHALPPEKLFGPDQLIALRLIEIESGMKPLAGVVMELQDAAFPLLHSIETTSDLNHGFNGAHGRYSLEAFHARRDGAQRTSGHQWKDFCWSRTSYRQSAAADVRVLVVGNPANTNCLIAMKNAPEVPTDRWHAMSRLDEDRARAPWHRSRLPLS